MPAHTAQSVTGLFYDGVLQPHAWRAALDAMNTHLQAGIFHFRMTPAPNFAGLRRSPIQQVYQ